MTEYEEALNAIYDNDNIKEKTRIEWVYNEFYHQVLKQIDDNEIIEYALIMEKTFKLLAETMNSQRDTTLDMKKFMTLYFDLLKTSRYFNSTHKKELLEKYEKSLNNILPIDIESINNLLMNSLKLEYKNIIKAENVTFKNNEVSNSFETIKYDNVRNYIAQFNKEDQKILMMSIVYSVFKSNKYSDKEIYEDLDVSKEYMKKAISTVIDLFNGHVDATKIDDDNSKKYNKKH